MANKEPTYLIKWIGGIVASVITAYLIANLVTNDNGSSKKYSDAGAGVLAFEEQNGLFKFEYPAFLDKVVESGSSNTPIVAISVGSSAVFQTESIENLSLIEKLAALPALTDLEKLGMVTLGLIPTYYLIDEIASTTTKNQSAAAEADVFAQLYPRSRELVDWNSLPSSGCIQKRDQGVVYLSYLYAGQAMSLFVHGRFTEEAWSEHRSEIRRMLGSLTIDEVTSVEWFKSRIVDGSIKYEGVEKLSEYLIALSEKKLSTRLQEQQAANCVETH